MKTILQTLDTHSSSKTFQFPLRSLLIGYGHVVTPLSLALALSNALSLTPTFPAPAPTPSGSPPHPLSVSVQAQQTLEGPTVVQVEYRVDDRVQPRVDVAQPGDEVLELVRGAAALAERQDDVHKEEGQPADDEHAHNDAECACRPSLLRQRDLLLLLDELVHATGLLLQGRGGSNGTSRRGLRRGQLQRGLLVCLCYADL